jgi:Na+-translocating ferredoxin:NAD+ oxidoreductase RnfC subunit
MRKFLFVSIAVIFASSLTFNFVLADEEKPIKEAIEKQRVQELEQKEKKKRPIKDAIERRKEKKAEKKQTIKDAIEERKEKRDE